MLDFYLLDASQKKAISHENLTYVGELDDTTFHNLQTKGILEKKYDYYSDFRLSVEVIVKIKNLLVQQQFQSDTDAILFRKIVDHAIENNCGLIAFGD